MDFDDEEYKIKGDRTRLNTSIANILENSIQYSKNSTIAVIFKKEHLKTFLIIRDYGVRSLPEISPVLLKKFSTVGNPFEASIMGNGLGVYVAKRFIEAHGGTLKITKENDICEFMIIFNQ